MKIAKIKENEVKVSSGIQESQSSDSLLMIAAQLPGPWEAPSQCAAGKGTGVMQVALPLQVRPVLRTALEKGQVRP